MLCRTLGNTWLSSLVGGFPGRAACALAMSARRRLGGPLALVCNGDLIRIDARAHTIAVDVSETELAPRRAYWQPPQHTRLGGTLEQYAALVGPAVLAL
jgi:dihydroxy-acid dehydratase